MSDREVRGLPEPKFTELSREDKVRLERQRAVVLAATKQRFGTLALTGTKSDLPVLQRLIDERVFNKSQTYELQCLGVALGDVLASELPLRWVMVTDEFGTDPTLRFKEMTLQVNALTMISKRVERDESVSVQWLVDKTREQLAVKRKEVSLTLVVTCVVVVIRRLHSSSRRWGNLSVIEIFHELMLRRIGVRESTHSRSMKFLKTCA